ncbi:glycosyltransferase family 2 protein [Flavobacterium sp. P21]|uniref:glycosyltransferase family 2 protein n=1 Tax=Flavobacterium sp. P21 TaxID=3423948 RepID=UPI003D674C44
MLNKPEISIIIPVYNRQDLLPYTLDSIQKQTFEDWECILIDDHSSDASFSVMESYEKKTVALKLTKGRLN